MKEFVFRVVAALVALVGLLILYTSFKILGNTDPAALQRFETVMKSALIPALTALLTFLAGTALFKTTLTAIDNASRLAKGKEPEKIELFS